MAVHLLLVREGGREGEREGGREREGEVTIHTTL